MNTSPVLSFPEEISVDCTQQHELANLLADAMKHPGVDAMMDVYSSAEKVEEAFGYFSPYSQWEMHATITAAACDPVGV